ncbi:MAG: alpha-galactosidase [Clostridia bacterium]|nr:alpha-galactosidase [Clostridia bacterium]
MIQTITSALGEPIFHLTAGDASYVISIFHGFPLHLYAGPAISDDDVDYLLVRVGHDSVVPRPAHTPEGWFSCDIAPFEYPAYGSGDFRPSAVMVKAKTLDQTNPTGGAPTTAVMYESHEILAGKPVLDPCPAVHASDDECDTLILHCTDPATALKYDLYYTVLRDCPALCRRTVIKNTSDTEPATLLRAYSASLDFTTIDPQAELVHLWGTWGRERHMERTPLLHGSMSVNSRRGASGHYHNPFAALVTSETTEEYGMAIGMSLIYSGNFDITADVDAFGLTRFMAGISPDGFEWHLAPGAQFVTPEAVIVISGEGLGKMSRVYHKLYRRNLCRGEWADKERPILVNNWEATYFNFDDEKLVAIAEDAAKCGIEMLVMDDGWFGIRNDDKSSLGDWFVNEDKIRCGLGKLVEKVNALGLKFGIWFEPEMISPVSKLYEAHPEWALQTGGRPMSISRSQYVLDMTREDVRDYLFDTISGVLSSANIEYVKWDFNRNLTEAGSALLPAERGGEIFHRYVLGLYDLLERLTSAFPHILLEGCSSGGGRFDPAMLYYSPQFWTSDDTDAMERLDIQLGTSFVYPASSMSCHVSASPNHQTGRVTSFTTRGNVAMAGAFGYELDLTKLSDEEKDLIRKQTADYHRYYNIINRGDLYRLILPTDSYNGKTGKCASWMYVSEDRSEALFTFVVIRTSVHPVYFVKLRGLDPNAVYVDQTTGREYHGDTLMNAGMNLTKNYRDGDSVVIHLIKK